MILLCFLLVLCFVFLITKQLRSNNNSYKIFWSPFVTENGECQDDKDCLKHQKCFASQCMTAPNKCDPETGYLEKSATDDHTLKCVCKKPDLVTQRLHGENCAIGIGCGVYGRVLSLDPLRCECRPGFKMSGDGRCVKMVERDRPAEKTCERNFVLSNTSVARQFFHPDYLKQFESSPRCLRMPCTFNALNPDEALEGGQIVQDKQKGKWACLCDPEYGNFGVTLDNNGNNVRYINGDGHNGCACIYKKEPFVKSSVSFDFYSYFYLKDIDEPVNFVVFRPNDKDQLIEPFKGKKSIAILDDFKRSFDQKILETTTSSSLKHRQRYCVDHGLLSPFYKHLCYDADDFENLDVKDCSQTPNDPCQDTAVAFGNDVYKDHFVCKSNGQIVVNPMAIDYEIGDRFSHGYKLNNRMGDWILSPAPTPRTAYLPLDREASKRLLGKKWKQNTNVRRSNIKYLRY